jgi:hypothetical protein
LGVASAKIAFESLLSFFIEDDHSIRTCLLTGSATVTYFSVNQYCSLFFGERDGLHWACIQTIGDRTVMAYVLDEPPFKGVAIYVKPGHVEIQLPGFNQRTDGLTGSTARTGKRVGNQVLSVTGIHFGKSHLHHLISQALV